MFVDHLLPPRIDRSLPPSFFNSGARDTGPGPRFLFFLSFSVTGGLSRGSFFSSLAPHKPSGDGSGQETRRLCASDVSPRVDLVAARSPSSTAAPTGPADLRARTLAAHLEDFTACACGSVADSGGRLQCALPSVVPVPTEWNAVDGSWRELSCLTGSLWLHFYVGRPRGS